jgi:Asp-tRNA(Asn)/Glu-tRNA(Gln) amidotransferase A subunit family amidase
VNYGGVPALAVPIPTAQESVLLTSLQLVGPQFAEADLLNAGRLVEAAVRKTVEPGRGRLRAAAPE